LRVFVNRFNASSAETDGFDLSASYRWDTDYGMFSLINDTTFVSSFDLQATPGGDTIRGAGKRNENNTLASSIPEIRSNTVLGWNSGPHNANLILRYIDDYEDTADTIDDWWVFDVQYSFAMEILADQQATITVGALNLTDEEPPAVSGDTNEFGYDTKVHDPRGRMLYTRLVYNF
jgi:iron complex outermembrane receptor protein